VASLVIVATWCNPSVSNVHSFRSEGHKSRRRNDCPPTGPSTGRIRSGTSRPTASLPPGPAQASLPTFGNSAVGSPAIVQRPGSPRSGRWAWGARTGSDEPAM
jgi:hypothetical protein